MFSFTVRRRGSMVGNVAPFLICALVIVPALTFPTQVEAGKYYPLEQGRTWTYRVTKTGIMGGETKYDFTREAIAIRTLNGRQVVPLEYTRDGSTSGSLYVIENDAGVMWYAQQSIRQGTPTLLEIYALRYPIREGHSWDESISSYLLPVTEKVPYTTTISSMTDSVTVAAGRFDNCLRLSNESSIPSLTCVQPKKKNCSVSTDEWSHEVGQLTVRSNKAVRRTP